MSRVGQLLLDQEEAKRQGEYYLVFIPSYGEAPDYEAVYTVKDLEQDKCPIEFAEDEGILRPCLGNLITKSDKDKICNSCNTHFINSLNIEYA